MDYSYYISLHPDIDKTFYNIKHQEPTWTTQNGEKLLISQMETSHLKNAIKCFSGNSSNVVSRKIREMISELEKRK